MMKFLSFMYVFIYLFDRILYTHYVESQYNICKG